MTFSFTLKFIFVAGCLVVALASYTFCNSKRDWAFLVGGLAFTVGADYFLVLRDWHLPGVAVFCFAHVCYILRALNSCEGVNENGNGNALLRERVNIKGLIVLFIAFMLIAVFLRSVIMLAVLYASLFIANIIINFIVFRMENHKTRLPKVNRCLVLAGLVLFALCDINVLLFNLPRYFNAPYGLRMVFPLIWVFYLPAQVLLAVSGFRYRFTSTASPLAKE